MSTLPRSHGGLSMNKIKNALNWFFRSFIWLFALLLIADIVTKLVFSLTMNEGDYYQIIPGFLRIRLSFNANAAFGMGFTTPEVNRVIYIIIAIIGTGIILYFYVRKFKKLNLYVRACLMLMLTGAIGNLIDRLFYVQSNFCVVDWIDFCGIWAYIFNLADSGIVVGTIMLIIWLIIEEVKEYKAQKALEPKVEGKLISKTEQEQIDRNKEEEKVDN